MLRFLLKIHRHTVLRLTRFLRRRFGERATTVGMALLIGSVAALAAVILHWLVTWLNRGCSSLAGCAGGFSGLLLSAVLILLPLIGMTGSHLIQRWLGGVRYAKSLSPLILMLNRRRYNIPLSDVFTHVLSSACAVGFGGSAGLEAPSVITGAAIGANGSSFLGFDRRHRVLLIGCGAAAAISAIFNSPVGGVLFAVEVLLPEFSVAALIPMLMASAIATVVSRILIADHRIFSLELNEPWRLDAIPCYFLCGIIAALVGVYVIKTAYWLAALLHHRLPRAGTRLLAAGLLLGVLLALFPLLRGQGYGFVEAVYYGRFELLIEKSPLQNLITSPTVLLAIAVASAVLLKVIASVLTVDGGGDGGIFAPSMFIGAFFGFAFARIVNLTGIIELQEQNFIVAGMCGVFTAVMRAPLTGVFLIAEVTGSYILLVPLMIVSSVSWFTAGFFEPNSIYRKALAENRLLVDDRDQALLQRLPVRLNLDTRYQPLHIGDAMYRVIDLVENHPGLEIFPVLDDHGGLLGVVHLDKILSVMIDPDLRGSLLVFDLMESPRGLVTTDDHLGKAMANLERFDLKYLPVNGPDGVFRGFVSKAAIFAQYRRNVSEA